MQHEYIYNDYLSIYNKSLVMSIRSQIHQSHDTLSPDSRKDAVYWFIDKEKMPFTSFQQ